MPSDSHMLTGWEMMLPRNIPARFPHVRYEDFPASSFGRGRVVRSTKLLRILAILCRLPSFLITLFLLIILLVSSFDCGVLGLLSFCVDDALLVMAFSSLSALFQALSRLLQRKSERKPATSHEFTRAGIAVRGSAEGTTAEEKVADFSWANPLISNDKTWRPTGLTLTQTAEKRDHQEPE